VDAAGAAEAVEAAGAAGAVGAVALPGTAAAAPVIAAPPSNTPIGGEADVSTASCRRRTGASGAFHGAVAREAAMPPLPAAIRYPPRFHQGPSSRDTLPDAHELAAYTMSAFYNPLILAAIGVLHADDYRSWEALVNGPDVVCHPLFFQYYRAQPSIFQSQGADRAIVDGSLFDYVVRAVRAVICIYATHVLGRAVVLNAAGDLDAVDKALTYRALVGRNVDYVAPALQRALLDPRPGGSGGAMDSTLQAMETHYLTTFSPSLLVPFLFRARVRFSAAPPIA